MINNATFSLIKFVFLDIIGDFFYWPIWWYSKGLIKMGRFCLHEFSNQVEQLGVLVWIKNLFTPMFGQYDIQGRLISFFMRIFQIIIRSFAVLIFAVFYLILFLLWPIMPIIILYQMIDNIKWLIS